MKLFLRRLKIKFLHWEYWPLGLVYAPIFFYWVFQSLRTGSPLFFTAANPRIRNGGMIGESKFDILQLVPSSFVPETILIEPGMSHDHTLEKIHSANLSLPLIAKPDVGERGFMVKKITTWEELKDYQDSFPHAFMVQDYIDLPYEAGIFYFRLPGDHAGKVTSLVEKEMLSVCGDGKHTLKELICRNDRAFLQYDILKKTFIDSWNEIPELNQQIELVSIGNHCRGTKFLNGNHLISERLSETINRLALEIDEFHYGRFDVRARNFEELEQGNFFILEVNGAGAEPAHIYHPGASFWEGQKTLFYHWKVLADISEKNHRERGFAYPPARSALDEYRRFKSLKRFSSN